jgi:FAD/FMN-containing dehydrogenase
VAVALRDGGAPLLAVVAVQAIPQVTGILAKSGGALVPVAQTVRGWGMAVGGLCEVVRPQDEDDVRIALLLARTRGQKVALRGSGCSYGDAACGTGQLVVDTSGLKKVLTWDRETGVVRAQAGVTLRELWQLTLPEGWWPPVVSGTMEPTLGGAVAMNIHGKNAWKVGPIGDHVRALKVMLPDGSTKALSRTVEPELFFAVIGGFGELAVILEVELQLKRVHAGRLEVRALAARDLLEMCALFRRHEATADYLVGWIDAFASGPALGRGQLHVARMLKEGEDLQAKTNLSVGAQTLPPRLFGIVPKSWMWALMKPFAHDLGWRLVCAAKYAASRRNHDKKYLQTHAAFHFLLDYVPNWKWVYKPWGLIQHQSFVPLDTGPDVLRKVLQLCQERGLPSWLAVLKRHRRDEFLMSHGLDGWSLALDFRVTPKRRERLWDLCHAIDALLADAGGRCYFAKDATIEPASVIKLLPRENLRQFATLRARLDPGGLLRTDLYERALAPALRLLEGDELR